MTTIPFTEFDAEKLTYKEFSARTDKSGEYPYVYLKLQYDYGGKKGDFAWDCPELRSAGVRVKVDENNPSKVKRSVTLMHDYASEDGEMHRAHVEFLDVLYGRICDLTAIGLADLLENAPKSHNAIKKELKSEPDYVSPVYLKRKEIRKLWFEIEGEKGPIERAEERPAFKCTVKFPGDFSDAKFDGLAVKYYLPSPGDGQAAPTADSLDMVDNPHTGKYTIRLPFIYVGKTKSLDIYPQIFGAECYNTKPAEGFDFEEKRQEKAAQYVEDAEKVQEYGNLFSKRAQERRDKAVVEKDAGDRGVQHADDED